MKFALVNESKDSKLTETDLERIASAVERQLFEHYAPFWESSGAPVKFYPSLSNVPAASTLVVILDDAKQAGYLGYHDVTSDGRSYARVFWEPIKRSGGMTTTGDNSLSVTVSHEVLEIIGDPYASFWATNPNTDMLHALELCDACEAESYEIDGVSVSNFVGPRFFRNGPGPYDWLSQIDGIPHLKNPFDTLPGGYQIVAKSVTEVSQIFGAQYPEWKKEGKQHTAARTAKRLKR